MSEIKNKRYARFMFELRELGLEANRFMSERIEGRGEGENDQFLIACLVTKEEILRMDMTVFDEFMDYMNCLGPRANVKQRYLRYGRVACLLNIEDDLGYYMHGEARLLDPYGKIRETIGIWRPENGYSYFSPAFQAEPRHYLREMKSNFSNTFGSTKGSCLLMFSHYLPCTLRGHKCARLISAFKQRTRQNVTVAYKYDFHQTDKTEALESMDYAGVRVLQPWYMRQIAENYDNDWMWDREY